MAVVRMGNNVQEKGEKVSYLVTFLRGRRSGHHIEILEIVNAEDAEEAVCIALHIAGRAKWHIEKVERMAREIKPSACGR